jgi:flotillin
MQELNRYLGGFVIPIVVVVLALTFLLTVRFIASRYKKVPPTKAGIFYGRKYRVKIGDKEETRGFMVVLGGGRVLMPLVESYQEMSTAAFQVTIDEDNIPNADNVKFVIKGVATCKVSTIPENLYRAAGAFLDKNENQIEEFIRNILKGHLRSIVGKLDINGLLRERDNFNRQVVAESSPELSALGMELVNLVIQDISDTLGYIDALGQRAVAETKADAAIKVAEANRAQSIAVSNAAREAALVGADNAAKIAEAEKTRDVKVADFKAISETQRAISEKAFAIATTAQDQKLRVAEAERDAAQKQAEVFVQEKEALRRQKELEATVIRDAEADKQTTVIKAEGAKQKRIIDAEAEASFLTATAQAKKNAMTLEGEGEAAKQKAILVAQAEGKAAEKKEALLGEAEGTQKLAEALREMNDAARLIIILDKLPPLLTQGGDAAAKVMQAVFGSIAAPLGQISKMEILDIGGSGRGIDQVSSIVPNVLFKFLVAAKAQGIDFTALLNKLGIDPEKALGMVSGLSQASKPASASPPSEPPDGRSSAQPPV